MPERRFAGDDEAFLALVLRYLDGATTPEENEILQGELADPQAGARRDLYVMACRQSGHLRETVSPGSAQEAERGVSREVARGAGRPARFEGRGVPEVGRLRG